MRKKMMIIAVMMACLAGSVVASFQSAHAEDIPAPTDSQLSDLTQNCSTIKSSLQQLSYSDTLARVNQGQLYEEMISNLMVRMNARIVTNRYALGDLQTTTEKFSDRLTTFRAQYQAYGAALQQVLTNDCSDATKFYTQLVTAQRDRAALGHTVGEMNALLAQYREQFVTQSQHFSGQKGVSK